MRKITVATTFGADVLLLRSMTAVEQLGRCYSVDLELLSEDLDLALEDAIGQIMTVDIEYEDGQHRYFSGHATEFSQVGTVGRYAAYSARLVPWFWFLGRTADCKVFQNKSVPEIIKTVFRDFGSEEFEDKLSSSYAAWDYCVQYRETALNFVSRLMEEEGIYCFFRYKDGGHTLVLADGPDAHEPIAGCEEIKFLAGGQGTQAQDERMYTWSVHRSAVTGKYSLNDFDYTKPRTALNSAAQNKSHDTLGDLEIYDFPSFDYKTKKEGEHYAKLRLEAAQAHAVRVAGETNSRGISVGSLFTLSEHPRTDQNGEYLVTEATHHLSVAGYESGAGGDEPTYSCSFEAIPSDTAFRLEAVTPKPVVAGAQTALVVGPSNEEIWTDEHGRVKVQFPWDRLGKKDQDSSCWVRVAQAWAGKNWGAVALPRIGQEVIVEFLEGDPDLPIVSGRVYNGDNKPPYALPANKTQSGIKSRSSPKGGTDNFNELRFEDKKGSEQVFMQAEKNLELNVKHDEQATVGHDRTRQVKNDETVTVDNVSKRKVGADETIDIGKKYLLKAGDQITLQTGQAKIVMKKNGDITISGKTISIKATDSVKISATNAFKAEGKMKAELSGMDVKVDGKLNVKVASGLKMDVKGTMTKVDGTMLDLSGAALAKLKGGITMIG